MSEFAERYDSRLARRGRIADRYGISPAARVSWVAMRSMVRQVCFFRPSPTLPIQDSAENASFRTCAQEEFPWSRIDMAAQGAPPPRPPHRSMRNPTMPLPSRFKRNLFETHSLVSVHQAIIVLKTQHGLVGKCERVVLDPVCDQNLDSQQGN